MKRKTKLILWGICAFWSVVLGGLLLVETALPHLLWWDNPFPINMENSLRNFNVQDGRPAAFDVRFKFLGIDDKTMNVREHVWDESELDLHPALKSLGEKPGPPRRDVYAHAVERLCQAGATLVILDVVLVGPMPGDEALKRVIETYKDRVVVGSTVGRVGDIHGNHIDTITFPPDSLVPEYLVNDCVGYANYFTDPDGVIRSYFPERGLEEHLPANMRTGILYTSMDRLSILKAAPSVRQPSGTKPVMFRYTGPPGVIESTSLFEIFVPDLWERNFGSGARFKDKIVVIGPAASVLQDFHRTPYEQSMLGPVVHINVLNAVLTGAYLHVPKWHWDLVLIPLGGFLAGLLNRVPQSLIRFALALLGVLFFLALSRVAYNRWDLYLIGATPALCLLLSTVTSLSYEIVVERMEKARVRSTLELYVSKNVANEIMRNMDSFKNTLVGARKPVTILFSDIRGFTGMTEGADEQELVVQLNQYFARMVDHGVQKHKGTLHKFIGDAIMAVWGDTVTDGPQKDACRAVRAALAMRRELPELNDKWEQDGRPRLKIGIGVNFGTVVVGDIGSEQRREFTVIGDAVNVASRLEGATKEFKTDILVGEEAYALVKDYFLMRTAGRMVVKGKSKPLTAYEPVAQADDPAPRFTKQEIESFELAVEAYYASRFPEALAGFEAFLQKHPEDTLGRRFADATREFITDPPEPGWDGVERLKSK